MKDKKHLVQLILAIITFTVLLIFVVNHLHIISGFFGMVFSVLLPFLIGCGIAFVLNIPMRGIEQGIFKNEKNRLYRFRRPISMVLTYIAALLFIALVLFVVVPEVADTVGKVKELLPGFVNRAKELALAYTKNVPAISEKIAGIEPDFDQIFSFFNDNGGEIMSATVSIFSSIIGTVINIFIGIIFSAYILAQKEKLGRQTKLVIYALFKEKTADELMVFGKIASTTFSKFFTGQFREGIILGIMFMIAMAIAGIQYPLTIGVLIAFTALIPVFGAFIGLFIALVTIITAPKQNYFIYPKLVGGDINLPAIWVLLAVIAGGDLMGVVGMFIFIPLVSVLYAYFRSIVYRRIKKREINVDDKQVPDDVVPLESAGRRLFAMKSKVEKTDSKKQNKEM